MTRWLVRDRVTVASVAVMAVGLAVLGIATNVVLSQQLAHDARALLQERTSALLGGIVVRQGRLEVLDINDGAIDRQSWIYRNHRAIERPIAPRNLQRAADRISRTDSTVDLTLGESTGLRATPVRAPDGTRVGTVVVATSLDPYEHSERIARVATIVLSLLVLGLCALVARRAVGSALRPVGDMAANASDWSEHHLDRRFALGPPRDELTSLAATLDGLLARVDSALRHEQRFSAEMAHELRTPLAGVRAQAELMLRAADSPPSAREGLRSILAACDRMASSIETLLLSARVTEAGGSSDPVAAVDEVVAALGPAATAANVKIELQDPVRQLRVGADQQQVAQALAPLLDNAISHARAQVRITTATDDGQVTLAVEDDGEGLPPGQEEALFKPGASTRGGAGLGLALARRLARSCKGDVVAVPHSSGARFELRLPGG